MILTPAEHAEVLRQITLWPVCPTCGGEGEVINLTLMRREKCSDCVKGRIPGPIYLTVEGDRMGSTLPHVKYQGSEYGEGWFAAPSRFVEATGPCQTCDGEGIRGINLEPPDQGIHWCPFCEGTGRKRIALAVLCPGGCIPIPVDYDEPIIGPLCRHCNATGFVVFAHATVEVLPVVDRTDKTIHRTPTPAHVCIDTPSRIIAYLPDSETVVTLDPLPRPGRDWIVVLDGVVLA